MNILDIQNPKFLKKLKKKDLEKLSEDIRTILGDIEASIEVRRMPEVVFVDYYLDNFRNIAITGDIDNSVTLAWINFAGGPYAEVDIIDDAGNILFRVPPITAKPKVDNKRMKGTSYSKMATRFQEESNRLQAAGDRFLAGALNGIEQFVTQDSSDYALRWANIFKRYAPNQQPQGNQNTSGLDDNLEFEYE